MQRINTPRITNYQIILNSNSYLGRKTLGMEVLSYIHEARTALSKSVLNITIVKLKSCLKELLERNIKADYAKIYLDDLIIIESRLSATLRPADQKNTTSEEREVTKNQIRKALLDLVNDIEELLNDIPAFSQNGRPVSDTSPNPYIGKIDVVITLDRKFEEYDTDDQRELLEAISKLMNLNESSVTIKRIDEGSVKVTITINRDRAKELLDHVQAGNLAHLGVTHAELVETSSVSRPDTTNIDTPPLIIGESPNPKIFPEVIVEVDKFLSQLYLAYRDLLLANARYKFPRLTKPSIEDLVAETFSTFFEKIKNNRIEPGTHIGKYLHMLMRKQTMRAHSRNSAEPEVTELSYTPMNKVEYSIDLEIFLMESFLSPIEGKIFLYRLEGYSHPEIAKMLNITEGRSRRGLWNARTKLKKYWKEKYKE